MTDKQYKWFLLGTAIFLAIVTILVIIMGHPSGQGIS